jgi:hypothetical protein
MLPYRKKIWLYLRINFLYALRKIQLLADMFRPPKPAILVTTTMYALIDSTIG